MDRVAEVKKVLDRLDTPQRQTLDPFKGARARISADATKALSDHRAVQERIQNSPSRPNLRRESDMGSLTPKATKQVKTEPVRSTKLREDKNPTCKPRPETNRGMGGSRNFVPWCDRNRR